MRDLEPSPSYCTAEFPAKGTPGKAGAPTPRVLRNQLTGGQMRQFLLGCTIFGSAPALACKDVTSPTPYAEVLSGTPSAIVNRFTDAFADFFVDESRGLVAVIGLGHDQLPAFCAGEEVLFDQLSFVEVIRPDGTVKITLHGKPRVTVYSATDFTDDVCVLAGATPLATGQARLTGTDNDVQVSHTRTNSFGRSLVGTASGIGGRFKVRGSFRITIDRDDNLVVRHEEFSITPLGG